LLYYHLCFETSKQASKQASKSIQVNDGLLDTRAQGLSPSADSSSGLVNRLDWERLLLAVVEIAEYLCVPSVRVRRMPLVDGLDLASLTTHGANYDSETQIF
jgi:hypothetical protein